MAKYGAIETNPLEESERDIHSKAHAGGILDWTDPKLVKIVRLRLLSDPGYYEWDVSYCYGLKQNGKLCRVQLPFSSLPKKNYKHAIIKWAKKDGVHAKNLGIFDNTSILI